MLLTSQPLHSSCKTRVMQNKEETFYNQLLIPGSSCTEVSSHKPHDHAADNLFISKPKRTVQQHYPTYFN